MASNSDDENQFRSGVRSFLNRADRMIMKFINESTFPAIPSRNQKSLPPKSQQESIHKFIEEMDKRSVGRELFNYINDNVTTRLKPSIQNQVHLHPQYTDEDNLVSDCVENIMNSCDYKELETSLCESIDHMSKQIRSECSSVSIELENVSNWTRNSSDHHVQVLFREEDDQSLSSSCSVDCWEMLNGERLLEICTNLDLQAPQHVQRESLKLLTNSAVSELVTFDSWPLLKAQLQAFLLSNPPPAIFDSLLQLHVKMMLSSSSLCVREGYTNIATSFYLRFQHFSSTLTDVQHFDTDDNYILLALGKLMNVFQKTLPRYWTRFPEQHNESMVEITVKLLSDTLDSSKLTPVHLFGLLDFSAGWFKSWMTGQYGKKHFMAALKKYPQGNPVILSCEEENSSVPIPYMNYLFVLHLLNILQSLFMSSQGCQLFDTQVKTVNVHGFVYQLVETVSHILTGTNVCNRYCLGHSTVELVVGFISQIVDCKEPTDDILESLRTWADSEDLEDLMEGDIHSLNHLADCLLSLTDRSDLLRLITNEIENEKCDVTLMDSVLSITEKLSLNTVDFSDNVSGLENVKNKFIKLACRLCSDHCGINRMLLRGLQLLRVIAEEWESVLRQGEMTPVPGDCPSNKSQENSLLKLKEISCVGCTPVGAFILQELGILFDLIDAIDVNFDVGYDDLLLLSHVASVAVTLSALYTILDIFANNLWVLISEEIISETNLETCINRLFSKLVSIIPPGYFLKSQILFATDPGELLGLNRLLTAGVNGYQVCMCSELACETGLQLLVILCSDLDCWLYLHSEQNLKESLLSSQVSLSEEETNDEPYINQITLLRNYLLVKTAEIGGEGEKILPLNNYECADEEERQWCFMCSEEIPDCYLVLQSDLKDAPHDLQLFLKETSSTQLDANWLNYCREEFRKCLIDGGGVQLRSIWFGDLLYYAMEAQEEIGPTIELPNNPTTTQQTDENEMASNFIFHGCHLIKRYGVRLKLLEDNEKVLDDIMEVMSSDLHTLQQTNGFDWLTATVFLLMGGNATKTYVFMKHITSLGIDLWLISCKQKNLTSWITFCQNVEVLMHKELPLVANALRWCGLSVGQVCQLWVGQCFWNILNWEEICQYMGLCLVMGQDFQVYCMVAIFRHLQKEILEHSQREDLSVFLKESRLCGFSFKRYLFFMDYLESKYKDLLHASLDSGNLQSILKS